MFGLSFEKIIVAGIIAVIIIGPSRLPHYAQRLGEFVRLLRAQIDGARDRAAESLGVDDWQTLDPRAYDPRRIVREALENPAPASGTEHLTSAEGSKSSSGKGESQTAESDGAAEGTIAEAAGRYVVTGSSGHPRRRFVAAATADPAADLSDGDIAAAGLPTGHQSLKSKSF